MFWLWTGRRQLELGGGGGLRTPPRLPSAAGWKVTEDQPEDWWDHHHTQTWPRTSFVILMFLFFFDETGVLCSQQRWPQCRFAHYTWWMDGNGTEVVACDTSSLPPTTMCREFKASATWLRVNNNLCIHRVHMQRPQSMTSHTFA